MNPIAVNPNPHISPRILLDMVRAEAEYLLIRIGATKLREEKMVSPSFNFLFEIVTSDSLAKKSLAKLVEVLQKHIRKSIPFFEYLIGITSQKSGVVVPVSTTSPRQVKVIKRYISFINYKCRKNGVPGYLSFENISSSDCEAIDRANNTFNENSASKSDSNIHKVVFIWGCHKYIRNSFEHPTGDMDDVISANLSKSSHWDKVALNIYSRSIRDNTVYLNANSHPVLGPLISPERIFFFLPEIIKSITTISRKGLYDYRAFSISADQ